MNGGKLLDVVQDAKLRSEFGDRETIHIFRERDPEKGRRYERRERWQRQRQIGGGAFGQVWLEKCLQGPKEGSFRAVKQIATLEAQSLRSKDFERELEALIKFSQDKYADSFVKTFGWYSGPNALYIAMEYLAHGDLRRYMRELRGPMPEHDAREVCAQILEAISDMHENHFAHRDLKPENVLLQSTPPNAWWIKIGDFGISKRTNLTIGQSTTFHGGTIDFMSPELLGFIAGIDPLSADPFAADMWSLGETVFQMLVYRQTFGNLGLLARYVNDSSLFPTSLLEDKNVAPTAIDLIRKLMQPTPAQRLGISDALQHAWIHVDTTSFPSKEKTSEAPQQTQNIGTDLAEEYLSWTTSASRTQVRDAPIGNGLNDSKSGFQHANMGGNTSHDAVAPLTDQLTTLLSGPRDPQFNTMFKSRPRLRDLPQSLGVSLSRLFSRDGTPVPYPIKKCIRVINARGLSVKGLYDGYYIPSADDDAPWLVWLFDTGASMEPKYWNSLHFPVESVAGLLKHILRKLPGGGLIQASNPKLKQFKDAAMIEDSITRQDSLHAIINSLPDEEYATLRALCLHLQQVQRYENENDMTAAALAATFGPIIFSEYSNPREPMVLWPQRAMETILVKTLEIFDED